ncbi:MAG TPA: hypothetical protein VMU06_23140 [Stellaceae bacterium]|nr:hypothetical protein [Stellaceae bacterium]
MRKIGLAVAVIVVLIGAVGYGLALYGPPQIRTAINKVVQIAVPQADPRPALDDAIRQLPPGYVASYKTAEYDVTSDTLTVGGVSLRTTDGIEVSVEEMAVVHPSKDLNTAWVQAKANPAQIPQDKALPVAGAIGAKGVQVHAGTFDASMASVRIEGARLYPWALLHPGVPAWSEAIAKASMPNPQPKIEDIEPLLRLESAVLLGVGYDHYVAENMHISGKTSATPAAPAMKIVYDFRKFEGANFERGAGGDATAEGVSAQLDEKGGLTVDHVAMAGLNLRKPLSQVLENQTLAPEMLDGFAIGKIEYAGMKFTPTGGAEIPIGTLSISKIVFTGSVPVSGELAFAGLKLSRTQLPDPKSQEVFNKLGIETMTISFGLAYRWELDKKRVTVTDLRYKVDELGAANVSVDLAEMTPSLLLAVQQGQLAHAVVRYDDGSGIERALKIVATENQTDPAAFRQQVIDMVEAQAQAMGDSPEISAAAKALVAFLQAPKNLTVELAPAQPVPFASLQGAAAMPPPEVAKLVGLKVTANQ